MTRAKVSDPHPDFDVAKSIKSISRRFGVTPIGMVYTFHDNVGVSMDLSIGKPYIGSVGINYKIN
jgi:hypothetical protein